MARALLLFLCAGTLAQSHPASGIVIDAAGNIYFIDSRNAVIKNDRNHVISTIKPIPDGHWLALDEAEHFARSTPKYFERITPAGAVPTLIYAGGAALRLPWEATARFTTAVENRIAIPCSPAH